MILHVLRNVDLEQCFLLTLNIVVTGKKNNSVNYSLDLNMFHTGRYDITNGTAITDVIAVHIDFCGRFIAEKGNRIGF